VVLEQCLVDGLAAFAGEHQFDQLGRPGQAARTRGQDAPLAATHTRSAAENPVICIEIACRAPSANCHRRLADCDSG
jgi:hypothetical protein